MGRGTGRWLVLGVMIGDLVAGWIMPGVSAQSRTDDAGHPVVGSWLIYETNPPAGGEPVLAGVATFSEDGNALVIFGDQQLVGSWVEDGPREATFTMVAPSAGGFGELDRLRASLEAATDGGPVRGIYTFDIVGIDGSPTFTYRGPVEGRRIEVQAPDHIRKQPISHHCEAWLAGGNWPRRKSY